ncbi:antitoxin of toxin-antitoxin stability system [Budvicia diplopodorum]|uniref:antitoxin of toxin-antitoxin stability system n=1 Tax=Budvicia diplopodorum TaxID=1119056 RepID=UPI001FE8C1A7|nr:antitoxin of toxin-antitoxin stability system [Budvicia diplopodorum]
MIGYRNELREDTKNVYTLLVPNVGDSNMTKEAVFTLKLETELRDEFMAEAEALHRPASQIVREFMREFVQRQRESREYDEFLHNKINAARSSIKDGNSHSDEQVEAAFAARRARIVDK